MIVIKSRKNGFDSDYVICYIECVGKHQIERQNMTITNIEIATIFVATLGVIAISLTTTALYVAFDPFASEPVVIQQPVVEQPVVYQYTSTEPRTCDEIVGTGYDSKFIRDGIANGEIMKVEWRTEGWGQTRTVWLYCPVK